MGKPRRLLIADDNPDVLELLVLNFEAEGFEVVAEAVNGLDGVAVASELHPDIVLVDVKLPDIDGFEVAERVADGDSAPPVVLTSIRSAADFGSLIEASRARAFIMKADITGEALAGFLEGRAATT